jgi:hypothetical protein
MNMSQHNEIPSTLISQVENWGYILLPPSHPESPGYTGLLVAMRPAPTGKHFDPENLHLHAVTIQNKIEGMTFDRNPTFTTEQRIIVGEIKIADRYNKVVEFFTFGGWLESAKYAQETIYSFRSSAPIMFLTPRVDTPSDQLVSEVQVQLNALRAQWGVHETEFDQRLISISPRNLYEAALRSLLAKYGKSHALHDSFVRFYKLLTREVEWLKMHDSWSASGQTLEEMFAR